MYVELNTKRIRAAKGPRDGQKTLFITRDGKMAVTPMKLGVGRSIWIPRWLAWILCQMRLANGQNSHSSYEETPAGTFRDDEWWNENRGDAA